MSPRQRSTEIISPMSSVTMHSSFVVQQQNREGRRFLPRTNWRQLHTTKQQVALKNQYCTSSRPLVTMHGTMYQQCQRMTLASISFPNNSIPWYYKQRLVFQINQVRRRLQFILNDDHLKRTNMILPTSVPREHKGTFQVNVVHAAPSPKNGSPSRRKTRRNSDLPKQSSPTTDRDRHHHHHDRRRCIHDRIPALFRSSGSSNSNRDMTSSTVNKNEEPNKENLNQRSLPADCSNRNHSRGRKMWRDIAIVGKSKPFIAMKNNSNNNNNFQSEEEHKENLSQSTLAARNTSVGEVGMKNRQRINRKSNVLRDVSLGGRNKNSGTFHSQTQQQQQQRKDWYIREAGMVTRSAYCSMEVISFDKKSACFHRTEIAYPFQPCIKSNVGRKDEGSPQRRLARTLQVQTAAVNNVYKHSLIWQ
jgi:hypothetical protein